MFSKIKDLVLGEGPVHKYISSTLLLVSRLTVGWIFFESGMGKLQHLDKTIEFFKSLNIPAAELQAPFAAGVEFLGGIALMAGLLTRIAALPLIPVMIVAILTAKLSELERLPDLFMFQEFLLLLVLAFFVVYGGGCVSIDAKLRKKIQP